MTTPRSPNPRRVLMLGATGTIGKATTRALAARGHEVTCLVRPGRNRPNDLPPGVDLRACDVTDPAALVRDGIRGARFDALVSCLASRTGSPRDAWAIDHKAHSDALAAAREAGVTHVVLLSAICVQKPLLEFQKAKLAFEEELIGSGLSYSIVRPTAFFKSLSGQVERVRQGKPFLLFGDGALTACKPISDDDLGAYIADCLDDESRRNKVLPIGGPGPAITPREQGEELFRLMGREPKFRSVPVGMMDAIIAVLGALGRVSPRMRDKAEFARIGRYYATESMLVLDPATGRYDADATPETGTETLYDFYARLVRGDERVDLGEHAMF
ncbi:NAD(P)H-binding protein [Rhodovulum marinum]|uniref:Divinyl chlorophyllide a 8-vinyl-reductase, chloroplastic n=1 Tax=Rhodovulum marinum TaxID=320662 RepID=A0A4R2Q627_9RHOB|nr:NAD(P)H-binding protein [Rhodovulum marinum]TCP44313.1 divinylchlorophyllide 8-vinylreductase [Rhodovulum marinum]